MLSRISVKVGKVGKGKAHANYIFACGAYAKKSNEVQAVGIANMPTLSHDKPVQQAIEFFDLADKHERKNGTAYREHILSLPREFSLEQQRKVVESWIERELKHLPTAWAIHHVKASDGKLQPHAHIMFSERINDGIERPAPQFFKRYNSKNPERGGAKKSNLSATYTERKDELKAQRERWGEHLKEYCYEFDYDDLVPKIDMRNWKARGLQHKPKNIKMHDLQQMKRKPFFEIGKPNEAQQPTQIIKLPVSLWYKNSRWDCAIEPTHEQATNEIYCSIEYDLASRKLVKIHKTNDSLRDNFLMKNLSLMSEKIENEVNKFFNSPSFDDYYRRLINRSNAKSFVYGQENIKAFRELIVNTKQASIEQDRTKQNNQNNFGMSR